MLYYFRLQKVQNQGTAETTFIGQALAKVLKRQKICIKQNHIRQRSFAN
jgi:hypothetical protein